MVSSPSAAVTTASGRTVEEIWRLAGERAQERRHIQEEADRARRAEERELAQRRRAAHLLKIAASEDTTWSQVQECIAERKEVQYERAVALLKDLREVLIEQGRDSELQARLAAIRAAHKLKGNFLKRMDKAQL